MLQKTGAHQSRALCNVGIAALRKKYIVLYWSADRVTNSTRPHLLYWVCLQEGSSMARTKRASKQRPRKMALPALGAAGMTLAIGTGASATTPLASVPPQDTDLGPVITLGEEEIFDVSLATFYVFDRETTGTSQLGGVQLAAGCRGCGCRGCAVRACRGCAVRACRGCGCAAGCRGCVARGCGGWWWGGCAGCGCSCCWSWGACRLC